MGWWQNTLQRMGLVSAPAPQLLVAGVGIANGSSFSPVASMSAFAAFPWVRACVDAICTDLSGLPVVVVQGEGAQAQQVTVQGLSGLLARPTSRKRRAVWERQVLTHLLLSGNAYLLRVGPDPRRPVSLSILHPEGVRIIPNDAGEADAYEYRAAGGGMTVYDASVVVHISLTSWEYGAQGLYGEGLIRALRNDLEADQAASKLSAAQSNQGRPSAIFKPKEPITREQQDMVADAYRKIASEKRPSMVLPADFDVDFPAFTLRDMEFVGQRTYTRDSILAAFGVPPTRVGLPSANYATAQEQSKIYWRQLQGIAALIDDALTELALGWGAYRVAHDFSSVDALQESRDARLNRVASWTMLGASPSDAAAYEGFTDAPLSDSTNQAQVEPVAVGASARPVRAVQPKTLTFADWWTRALDPDEPRLEQSEYERPPFGYVRSLKADYPEIWGAGGNERGNEAFEYWTKYQDGDRSEGVLAWLKEREAWAARHYEDADMFMGDSPEHPTLSNIGGVVAWLKWGVVGQLGWERIKNLVDALKEQQAAAKPDEDQSDRELERTALWRGWLSEVQTPGEAALARATKAALAQQAAAISERMGVLIPDARSVTRDAGALSALVDALFTADIQALLRTLTLDAYRNTVRIAYARAAKQVGQSLAATRADPLVEQLIAVMVANVNGATKDMIATVIADGLATGATTADMQRALQDAAGFSPMRALRIARTESTRSAAAGASYAWQNVSADTGVTIRREWLTARDGEVRDAHRHLDGQTVNLGQPFVIQEGEYAGRKAMNPGDFDAAALVVNCRCTVLPVVTNE